ncbi:hypothetical protein LWI29_012955 [Acer saccharum]|uniref:Uncharacterized protein n=1 Tax=Acer saccharum TaxID=4024 RepID=A0AA39SSZ1_ACESA|nr:hypothetical protein LWI29_012955 [Acer saccharum]
MEMINDTDEDNYKQQNNLCFKRLCSNFNKKAVSKAKNVGQLLQQANFGAENTFILEKETEAADNKTPEESIKRTSLKFSRCISTERLLRGLETFCN